MSEAVLVALIGAGGLIGVALIAMIGEVLKTGHKVKAELQGNGHGSMLQMVTDLHTNMGSTGVRLDSLERRLDELEDDPPKRF